MSATLAVGEPALDFFGRARVRVQLQSEASECGHACLAMLASYWGRQTETADLRRGFATSGRGLTLRQLIAHAAAIGLQARALRADLERLGDVALPAIAHWGGSHYVVLVRYERRRGRALVCDPARGQRWVDAREFGESFTGVVLEVAPGEGFEPRAAPPAPSLRSVMGRAHGLRRSLAQLAVLGVFLELCVLMLPVLMQYVVDQVVVGGDEPLLGVAALAMAGVVVLRVAASTLRAWVATVLATRLQWQWSANVFGHLLRLPVAFFERRSLGDIASRFSSLVTLQQALTSSAVQALLDGAFALAIGAILALYSPRLALVAVGCVGLYALARAAMQPSARAASAERLVHVAQEQTLLLESVRGIETLRLFARETERRAAWLNALARELNAQVRLGRLAIVSASLSMLVLGLARVAVVWLAVSAVLRGEFTLGAVFAVVALHEQFTERVAKLVDALLEWRTLRVHAQRLAEIVHEPAEEPAGVPAVALAGEDAGGSGAIELEDVWFRYGDEAPWILRGVSLRIEPGQSVALAGASGSGKTTLVKIVLGLLRPTHGRVACDGRDIASIGLAAWRARMGCVMQSDILFGGTIASNVAFGDETPDLARIGWACGVASIAQDIAAMPMGYDTLVGDLGSALSGGQRQRLCLARALYRRPSVLVLDEATSHLDGETEQRVSRALAGMRTTRLIVAHRAETLASAERVVRLHDGRVVPAAPGSDNRATAQAGAVDDRAPDGSCRAGEPRSVLGPVLRLGA